MLATGESAVIMKKIGEQKTDEEKEDFTFLIIVNVIVAIVMCAAGYLAMDSIFARMNLSADVEGYCVEYLSRYLVCTVPNRHVYIHQAIFSTKVLRWLEKFRYSEAFGFIPNFLQRYSDG